VARRPSPRAAPHEMSYYLPDGRESGSVKMCLLERLAHEHEYVSSRAWTFQERMLS
jgi:hypothetical protein